MLTPPFTLAQDAIRLIEEAGACVMPLPPYSPDLNPIEKMWSKIKECLRDAKARTQQTLDDAIAYNLKRLHTLNRENKNPIGAPTTPQNRTDKAIPAPARRALRSMRRALLNYTAHTTKKPLASPTGC